MNRLHFCLAGLFGLVLLGASTLQAEVRCTVISETTSAGTFEGQVCVDTVAGTVTVQGTATLNNGQQCMVDAAGTITRERVRGKTVVCVTGTATVDCGEQGSWLVRLRTCQGALVQAVESFALQAQSLVLR